MSIKKLLAVISLILTLLFEGVGPMVSRINDVAFRIDASATGEVIGNKVSNANVWSIDSVPAPATGEPGTAHPAAFLEYIQLMTATGGSAQRDLFKDPSDKSVLNDYDFAPLINACRNILALGAKPHIKLGNVPLKYSAKPSIGVFGVNVRPPADYRVYYDYIAAAARALVDEFGAAEVLDWRFGVLTEYENADWFKADSGLASDTLEAYCRLYDTTVAALQDTVGQEVYVGAHSMSVAEGLWDERDFIEHCANGTNYCTGAKGTRLCYLSSSFYDNKPGEFAKLTLPQTIAILREKAESVGLNNLAYGVDEGRILSGTKGAAASDLNMRICGFTYQAAYDARLIKQMADYDIDYFSAWGYTTAGLASGIPTVSYHVANRFASMSSASRVPCDASACLIPGAEVQALAGYDGDRDTVYIMAYNFKNSLDYHTAADLSFTIELPQFDGRDVKVTRYVVDDKANFFDEWQLDRKRYSITDDCFTWSPDDPCIESYTTLSAQWARDLYFTQLRGKYASCAALSPVEETAHISRSRLKIGISLAPNAVVFYEIKPA